MDELHHQIRDVVAGLATARLPDWKTVEQSLAALEAALISEHRLAQQRELGILARHTRSRRFQGLGPADESEPEGVPAGEGTLEVINRIVDRVTPPAPREAGDGEPDEPDEPR